MVTTPSSDLIYDHEENLEEMMQYMPQDGVTPVYALYSPDDEAYFLSRTPITVDRLKKELNGKIHKLSIIGTDEE